MEQKKYELEISLLSKKENLPGFLEPLESYLEGKLIESSRIKKITLCVEEAIVNIMNYAYDDRDGEIKLILSRNNQKITVLLIDAGKKFDPLAKEDPVLDVSAEERQIGGLGIFLIRKYSEEVSYQRKNNRNILAMVF